jgi:hypothetical protein
MCYIFDICTLRVNTRLEHLKNGVSGGYKSLNLADRKRFGLTREYFSVRKTLEKPSGLLKAIPSKRNAGHSYVKF